VALDKVTASMAPPVDVIERFIWEPIAEINTPVVFNPARPCPSCAIHGHTWSAATRTVIARVEARSALAMRSSPGGGEEASASVAPHVRTGSRSSA
jgi:hypothetical protein